MTPESFQIVDSRYGGCFQVEHAAVAFMARLGPTAWAVYIFLLHLANRPDQAPFTLGSIASGCGISLDQSAQSLERLIAAGLIAYTPSPNAAERRLVINTVREPERFTPSFPGPLADRQRAESQFDIDDEERLLIELASSTDDIARRAAERSMFERIADVCGHDSRTMSQDARMETVAAARAILAQGGVSEQVAGAAAMYSETVPHSPLTPRRLAEDWSTLVGSPEPGQAEEIARPGE